MNAICTPIILHSFNIWLYKLMNVDITMLDQNIKWKIVRYSSFWAVLSKLRDNMGNHKDDKKTSIPIRLGLRANINQFSILVLVNAFVGAMIGLEQTVIPLIGKEEFGIESNALIVSFIASFGAVKAVLNLFAGSMSDRWGRKRMLVLGWLFGLPVPFILLFAPDWNWIIFANVLLGINQGLAWSMTVNMKIDLVGKERRGLALGLNEFAKTSDNQLDSHKKATANKRFENLTFIQVFIETSWKNRSLLSVSQAGLINNLIFGVSWGLFTLYFASLNISISDIGFLKALHPGVWGVLQLVTGSLSDKVGRKILIYPGMIVQGIGIWIVLLSVNSFIGNIVGMSFLGIGTALVYPTLLAAISDTAHPKWRATSLGVYRFWRDLGFVFGAIGVGFIADLSTNSIAIQLVAWIAIASGIFVLLVMKETRKV